MNLIEKIDSCLPDNITDRHSFFQLKYFVIGKEPTTQSKLWRCVNEMESRKESLEVIENDLLELADNQAILELEIEELNDSLKEESNTRKHKVLQIEINKKTRKIKSIEKNKNKLKNKRKNTEEEALFFLRSFEVISRAEKIKPFDDEESQKEYWNQRLTEEMNLRLMLNKTIEPELAKTILSLDPSCSIKAETIKMINEIKENGRKNIER